MFKNCGTKCKVIAKISFWLISLIFVVGIIIIISCLGWYDGHPLLLLVIPVGILMAWLSSISLYTIGDIWELQYNSTQKTIEK